MFSIKYELKMMLSLKKIKVKNEDTELMINN